LQARNLAKSEYDDFASVFRKMTPGMSSAAARDLLKKDLAVLITGGGK
jgi:hypothetical protein